jgi:hypothetical protein
LDLTHHFKLVVILVDALGICGELGTALAVNALEHRGDAFSNKLSLSEASG